MSNQTISTSDKYYPKNAIVLEKKFNDIKRNLETIGLFVNKVLSRKEDGQHYSIKRAKSSTALQKACNNEGLGNVDKAVSNVDGNVNTGSSTLSADPSTADKSPVYAETVDDVDNADKNEPCEGWFTEISNVTDEDLPPEFLKPTPPLSATEQLEL